MFKNMILRNPVCNLFHSLYSTDIPGWAYHEGLGKGDKHEFDYELKVDEMLKF